MRQPTGSSRSPGEKIVKDIKRATRKHYSSEEKIRIVLDGLRGEDSINPMAREVSQSGQVISLGQGGCLKPPHGAGRRCAALHGPTTY